MVVKNIEIPTDKIAEFCCLSDFKGDRISLTAGCAAL